MSFFFRQPPSVEGEFTLKDPPDKAGSDTVLLSSRLWAYLSTPQDSRVLIIISSGDSIAPLLTFQDLECLTCWANEDPDIECIAIPPHWSDLYPHIFGTFNSQQKLYLSRAEDVSLSEVVLTAQTPDAYSFASSHSSAMEEWLFNSSLIIRTGEELHVPRTLSLSNGDASETSPSALYPYRYKIDVAYPYSQGIIRRNVTQFVVTCCDQGAEIGGDSSTVGIHSSDAELASEPLEISESFLITAALPAAVAHHAGPYEAAAMDACFRLQPLSREDRDVPNNDVALYLRTSDFRRVGVLDGDWAIVSDLESSQARLVRVFAHDCESVPSGVVKASPSLVSSIRVDSSGLVWIRPSPFGNRQPAIPVARSLTLSRITSPFSTGRKFETLFLQEIQSYFSSCKRMVKPGDLINVFIDTDNAEVIDKLDKGKLPIYWRSSGNAVVSFVVDKVDYDPINAVDDYCIYPQFARGDYGCFVDSQHTRIVQLGTQNKSSPDIPSYNALHDAGTRSGESSFSAGTMDAMTRLSDAPRFKGAVEFGIRPFLLISGARGSGKFTMASSIARRLGIHIAEINCFAIISENQVNTEGSLRARVEMASSCAPCAIVIRHLDALSQSTPALEPGKGITMSHALNDCLADVEVHTQSTGSQIFVIATASDTSKIPAILLSRFTNEFALKAPTEAERSGIIRHCMDHVKLASDVSVASFAIQTAALVAIDIFDFLTQAEVIAVRESLDEIARRTWSRSTIAIRANHLESSLLKARTTFAQNIGAPKIPAVMWQDIGGLSRVKNEILDTIQLPLEHPELFIEGLKKRSGILLYGPPGTGKTLLAKAVATSCSLNFFSVKGPELLNMYIGESEANVRRIFQRARDAKPCVIFFDELDSVAPKRGNQGDSGGVMDRIVSQLLAELDGMSAGGGGDVFVIGATNRPDLLDPALLRPGRFDRMLYLGVSDTHEAQLDILHALTRKFKLSRDLSLADIARECPFHYTGADFYALCSDAMLNALNRKVAELDSKIAQLNKQSEFRQHQLTPQYYLTEIAKSDDLHILVTQVDFIRALNELVPSVSAAEMQHYATIQRRFMQEIVEDM
ncbi:P-loop containing nucleoside triphosphate hydrolase protein [Suillus paluster]|uniref:P-loop containing nucleoside triphosphate hydrolase protein n=1 Tax=Suillus paluster TaxID=48578 RepID=UPI001B86CF8D|nr:P-loop containing nucleoside triphosphate hydrolase protein [Suillus paluster]KAG1756209.1 P-loop containing nucleoside triphosphate hydrolase protein [Suillus paluster]